MLKSILGLTPVCTGFKMAVDCLSSLNSRAKELHVLLTTKLALLKLYMMIIIQNIKMSLFINLLWSSTCTQTMYIEILWQLWPNC